MKEIKNEALIGHCEGKKLKHWLECCEGNKTNHVWEWYERKKQNQSFGENAVKEIKMMRWGEPVKEKN